MYNKNKYKCVAGSRFKAYILYAISDSLINWTEMKTNIHFNFNFHKQICEYSE